MSSASGSPLSRLWSTTSIASGDSTESQASWNSAMADVMSGTYAPASPENLSSSALIDAMCKIRFPRLNNQGDWVVPEDRNAMSRDLRRMSSAVSEEVGTVADAEARLVHSGIAEVSRVIGLYSGENEVEEDEMKPSVSQVAAFCQNYLSDVGLALGYTSGAMVFGSYSTAVMSLFMSAKMVVSNVGVLSDWIFDFFHVIEDELNDAIDRLQADLERDVCIAVVPLPFGIAVAIALGTAIDVAQRMFHITTFLPAVLQSKTAFLWRVSLPLLGMVLLHFLVEVSLIALRHSGGEVSAASNATLAAGAAVLATNATLALPRALQASPGTLAPLPYGSLPVIDDPVYQGRGPIIEISTWQNKPHVWWTILETFVKFFFLALIKSWPFVRFATNWCVRFAESLTNKLLRKYVAEADILGDAFGIMHKSAQAVARGTQLAAKTVARQCMDSP